jgi:hypothetical protein
MQPVSARYTRIFRSPPVAWSVRLLRHLGLPVEHRDKLPRFNACAARGQLHPVVGRPLRSLVDAKAQVWHNEFPLAIARRLPFKEVRHAAR